MGAGRRQEIPGSETIDFITHMIADSMSFMFTLDPSPKQVFGNKVIVDPAGCYIQNGYTWQL